MHALVSVHDLMPETLPSVRATLALLAHHRIAPVTLLVVPGAGWDRAGIAALKALQDQGHRLAGHGWRHRAERIGGTYHRLHSLLLSRDVAEHLALDADGILALVHRCHAWFGEHGLETPALYVPPAWALGAIGPMRLAAEGPFALYELFGGVLDARSNRMIRLPLLGYEADRPLRVPVLRTFNALNRGPVARWNRWGAGSGSGPRPGRPVRIGIHPNDIRLRMTRDLVADLARCEHVVDYADLIVPAPADRPCPDRLPDHGGG